MNVSGKTPGNKLHLTAWPANEGARRLAWWIGSTHGGDVAAAAARFGCETSTIDRLIAGEIVPGTELALPVGLVTDGFICRKDWQRAAAGGWFDQPEARASIAEMARAA